MVPMILGYWVNNRNMRLKTWRLPAPTTSMCQGAQTGPLEPVQARNWMKDSRLNNKRTFVLFWKASRSFSDYQLIHSITRKMNERPLIMLNCNKRNSNDDETYGSMKTYCNTSMVWPQSTKNSRNCSTATRRVDTFMQSAK